MGSSDYGIDELRRYAPEVSEPPDFDAFWDQTLAEARSFDLDIVLEPVDAGFPLLEIWDLTFSGFAGQRIKGWYILPQARSRGEAANLPVVVEYLGYGGGRGLPSEHLVWPAAGYAHVVMDTRGQGSAWGSGGQTPDPDGTGPSHPGFMTRGIQDPQTYYYRRLITDAVRAVDAARILPGADPDQVAVTGGSQGGGLALAVAGLVQDLAAVMPDVPFLCHFRRAIEVTDSDPYLEIARYLSIHRDAVDETFQTLSYVDGANFAARASAPALFSVALWDIICPPSTVFAAFNRYAHTDTDIVVYPFNNHEGGQHFQLARQRQWLADHMG